MAETAYLGLGSNLGDRLDTLQQAVDLLAAEPRPPRRCLLAGVGDRPGGRSATSPTSSTSWSGSRPTWRRSTCWRRATGSNRALGRVREVRWGPRTVDIDVLLFDDRQIDEPALTVPHPRMTQRAFVLLPLLDLDPDPVLPDGERVVDIRLGADAASGARPFAPPLAIP